MLEMHAMLSIVMFGILNHVGHAWEDHHFDNGIATKLILDCC